MRLIIRSLSAGVAASAIIAVAAAAPVGKDEAIEAKFDAAINPAEMDGWLKTLAAEPNNVGSPHDKANAEWVLAKFKDWGWDAKIETFKILYPTPLKVALDLVGDHPFSATLTEPPVAGDAPTNTKDALPAYLEFQGDGDVTAPLVYVNYGMPDDYETLKRMGVSVKGKIVIVRYGAGWRGLKPKLAEEHGAVGCIIYSDPQDDGYATDDVYPKGAARPPTGFQRGSVEDFPVYPGDPLTPGVGATEKAHRLSRAKSKVILHIPALPISYGDAQHLLAAMGGQVAPGEFRGSLGLTYHLGDDNAAKAHLVVQSEWSLKTIYDVVAMMPGSTYPDQWVLRGNHRDGWVMGASDPLSGQISLLGEAKAIGELAKSGWKPKRTLVYLSWDGEEPGLFGSTEWAETHADELRRKAVLYINSDTNARGFLSVSGSHSLQHFVNEVAADVVDPETKVSVAKRLRGKLAVDAMAGGASPRAIELGKIAADPSKDLPIGALGSGSDYSTFLQHLGLAALDVGYGNEGDSDGVYHSLYDDYMHHSTFVDPGEIYSGVLSKTVGRMTLRAADADLPPMRYSDFAATVATYLDEVEKLADAKRQAADDQAKAIAANAFGLAADPTKPIGAPTPLKEVPHFNFAPLENAVDRLKESAKAYDAALAKNGGALSDANKAKLFDIAREAEEALAPPKVGLPGRPWYQNLIYAPGTLTGYGAKTLPGVREAIEQERFDDVDKYTALTANALDAYAGKLDQGTALLSGKTK
ncbi:MAG TPA: transferrin receptor-like dimerization domain-containing protein [Parvularculaceae bacterium]|nr:transferrin receptor-like dimerization domain-containing protein [Parvularculaceae bacterium]